MDPAPLTLFVGYPRRPGCAAADPGAYPRASLRAPARLARTAGSLLNLSFNQLWAGALNSRTDGVRFFAMCHDDIEVGAGWADVLFDEMQATGADVVSVAVPLKDARGLTSTAVHNQTTGEVRRLTLAELFTLPPTFDLADLVAAGIARGDGAETLLVNTGLWLCRFGDWCDEFPGFRNMFDGVKRLPDGRFVASCLPEDWSFSVWAARAGLSVKVTRKVPLAHLGAGGVEYRNDRVWGEYATDPGDTPTI
jgi:hypothetical protein